MPDRSSTHVIPPNLRENSLGRSERPGHGPEGFLVTLGLLRGRFYSQPGPPDPLDYVEPNCKRLLANQLRWDRLESVGFLPHFLAQAIARQQNA